MPLQELSIERCERLIREAIEAFALDLTGLTVLTEAASGAFATTPLTAALAGAAGVVALTRDSRHATAREVEATTGELGRRWGVSERVRVLTDRADAAVSRADVVTNLGFVRPLDAPFLERLGPTAAVALMFEPWELRAADIDLARCRQLGIPVLGTNEDDERLHTFRYLAPIAAKLLFELEVEVVGSRLVLISAGRFAEEIAAGLTATGARVETFAPPPSAPDAAFEAALGAADAVIVADHPGTGPILGPGAAYTGAALLARNPGIALAHVSGEVDVAELKESGLRHAPQHIAAKGSMSVTAGYLGPRPVIDLCAAGLRVGAALARARHRGVHGREAEESVLTSLPLARAVP